MADDNLSLLEIDRGAVTAPAGCGKTQLIAESLKSYSGSKPILVLTHTNAGVTALRNRLVKAGVSSSAYRLYTIDGWAMRFISNFPRRAEFNPDILKLAQPNEDYPSIRRASQMLLEGGHVSDIVASTYARLIVDEYQDCNISQHGIVCQLSRLLPTCVLGDPLQAIFDFGGNRLADWEEDICANFPVCGQLQVPWRWKKAGCDEFGDWLLNCRIALLEGGAIDLKRAPQRFVKWVPLMGTQIDYQKRLAAARTRAPIANGRVLIMGDSFKPAGQKKMAMMTYGATTIEAVDLEDLVKFSKRFNLNEKDALKQILSFAQSTMTNVGVPNLLKRVDILARGAAVTPATEVENLALSFSKAPSYAFAAQLLVTIRGQANVRVHRPELLRCAIKALESSGSDICPFEEAVIRAREENRHFARPLASRTVGSTLLAKGLEAETAVILNADNLNVQHLYVAMTRGSMSLAICSTYSVLKPQ